MFILSFGLIGMNSVDLFSCNQLEGDTITYRRTKTFARRADHAEIQIKLQPPLQPLYDKYRDHTGTRVFNFYRRFSDSGTFNAAINRGLKEIGRELGIDDLEFYAARHSWATIAVNEVGIDKYDVHAALNHVDDAMRVTDIYIKKSFQAINDANKRVLSYLLDR